MRDFYGEVIAVVEDWLMVGWEDVQRSEHAGLKRMEGCFA